MHKFYCPNLDFTQEETAITASQELHHLRDVLRINAGEQILLFNGKGEDALAKIISISSRQVNVKILSIEKTMPIEPAIILACAIPKKSKFEMIVEKATELGVAAIIPLKTKRTELNLNNDRLKKKELRYHAVAVNASKQSKRSIIPDIYPITNFESAIRQLKNDTVIFTPSLFDKTRNILDAFSNVVKPKKIAFLIGPEGDFTEEEYSFANKNGCIGVSLGKTILKVETAAICAIACANQYYWRQ